MSLYFRRVIAVALWWGAIVSLVTAATSYSDTARYGWGGVAGALFTLGVYSWRKPKADDAEAMKRSARRAGGKE